MYAVKQLRAILIGGATSNHQTVVAAGRDGRASCLRQIHHFSLFVQRNKWGYRCSHQWPWRVVMISVHNAVNTEHEHQT